MVNLQKVTLGNSGEKAQINLTKSSLKGLIEINLNWSQPKTNGFLKSVVSLFQGSKNLDLDLGALIELKNGELFVVQPLGSSFGNLDQKPYVFHSGDDRTGDSQSGEFIRIKVEEWQKIQRVCIYAYIYEGAPDWATAQGVVTVKVPNQPNLEVLMGKKRNKGQLCAITMFENINGGISVQNLNTFHDGSVTGTWHGDLDRFYKWGINWTEGSK